MNEYYLERMEQIKEAINKTDTVCSFLNQKKKVQENRSLTSKVIKYHQMEDVSFEKEKLKKEIYQYEDYLLYKHYENELFYLTLAINSRLKKLVGDKECGL